MFRPGSTCGSCWLVATDVRSKIDGQLIVTSGCGWTQCWGEAKEEVQAGDVVWCTPGVKHWHGATPTTAMTHIVLQERDVDGKVVDWMETVADEEYRA